MFGSSRNNVRASEIGSTIPTGVLWQTFVDTEMQVQGLFLRTKQAPTAGKQHIPHIPLSLKTHHISLSFLHKCVLNISIVLLSDTPTIL